MSKRTISTPTALSFHVSPVAHGLTGELRVPGDKSISHRAVILSAIAQGRSIIQRILLGADNLATIAALQQLGVAISVDTQQQTVCVDGVGLMGLRAPKTVLDMGNSGTGLRLLAGLLAGQSFDAELTGDESLCKRPMARIVKPLSSMGAKIMTSPGQTAPLKIQGGCQLHGIRYTLPVASAQVKSCLMLAGIYATGQTIITEPSLSRDHTERMLAAFGYPLSRQVSNEIIMSGPHPLRGITLVVPGDISSAAFFMVAASIVPNSSIILKDVGINPSRFGVITILRLMGANIDLVNQRHFGEEPVADVVVTAADLQGIVIPESQVPLAIDEFPVIMIAAACAKGKTVLRGASELRVKETDRIAAMAKGLMELGITVKVLEDGMVVEGGHMHGGRVDSEGDHRIAMAFAVAGSVSTSAVYVENCSNVITSFPEFVVAGKQLGMSIDALPAA